MMQTSIVQNHTSPLQTSKSPLVIDRLVGSGKFAVFHAYASSLDTEYAVKAFPENNIETSYLFSLEKNLLSPLQHPNIIQYISESQLTIQDESYNVLILEYASHGDLYDLLASNSFLDECLIRGYFQQLIAGLEYLHSQSVAHLDVKPENLLIGQDYTLKIADFDQAQTLQSSSPSCLSAGTPGYRAPEIIQRKCKNIFAADVYSAGVVLYVMVAKQLPFVEEVKEDGRMILAGYSTFCKDNAAFWKKRAMSCQVPTMFDEDFRELINGMLKLDPEERFTLEQVKSSKWFKTNACEQEEFSKKMERIFH